MARQYANQFDAVMAGYRAGRDAVKDWQNDQIDTEAGQAFKDASQVKTQTESDFGKVDPNTVYSGAGADGVMTNAEAASYGVFAPEKETRKYGLGANPATWTDKAATPQEQNIAGTRAMGAVYSGAGRHEIALKYGAAADQSEANAQQRELTSMQIDAAKRTQDYEKGKNSAFATTTWAKAISEGRQPTPGEQLQSAAHLFAYDAQNGRATPQGMMEIAGKMQAHETENYTKAVQALHSGASKETIAKTFNASGMKIDPATLSDPKPVEVDIGGGQKVKSFEISYTDPSGRIVTLNGRRELDALGKGAESFNQAIALANLKNDTTKTNAAVTSAGAAATSAGAHVTTANVTKAKEDRAVRKEDALTGATAAYQAAIDSGDEKAIKKAKVEFIAAGGKLESPKPDYSATTDALGNTNVLEKSTGAGQKINTNGAVIARWNGISDKPKTGEEKIIAEGPNKGKTAVFDGKGWTLKEEKK